MAANLVLAWVNPEVPPFHEPVKMEVRMIRPLLDRSEIPALLSHLTVRAERSADFGTARNWRQRQIDNLKS
jgi:hypothetical protein